MTIHKPRTQGSSEGGGQGFGVVGADQEVFAVREGEQDRSEAPDAPQPALGGETDAHPYHQGARNGSAETIFDRGICLRGQPKPYSTAKPEAVTDTVSRRPAKKTTVITAANAASTGNISLSTPKAYHTAVTTANGP